MIDRGVVREVKEGTAYVEVIPHEGCSRCGNACMCGSGSGRLYVVAAENRAGASPGDSVTVDVNAEAGVFAAVVLFLFPLFFCALGCAAGWLLLPARWGPWAGLVSGIALSVIVIRKANSLAEDRPSFRPVVTEILDSAHRDSATTPCSAGAAP